MKHGSSRKERTRIAFQPQQSDGDSSLSSLGSLPEATTVTKHFIDDFPSQRRFTAHMNHVGSASSANVSMQHITPPTTSHEAPASSQSRSSSSRQSRTCPHCQRRFTNAWAIPKHVSVRFSFNSNVQSMTKEPYILRIKPSSVL